MAVLLIVAVIVGIIAMAAVIITVSAILNGWVLSILWGWFMVPIFNLPPLPLAPAIGVGMVIGYLTYHMIDTKKDDTKSEARKFLEAVGYIILHPLLVLFVGWIVHLFM